MLAPGAPAGTEAPLELGGGDDNVPAYSETFLDVHSDRRLLDQRRSSREPHQAENLIRPSAGEGALYQAPTGGVEGNERRNSRWARERPAAHQALSWRLAYIRVAGSQKAWASPEKDREGSLSCK